VKVNVREGTGVLADFSALPRWRLATAPIVWRFIAGMHPRLHERI
jgi:hypothetical protein